MPSNAGAASLRLPPKSSVELDTEDAASVKPVSPGGLAPSSGTKRKRASEPRFYAVKVGSHPGIYHTWAECLDEVKGFKNATCTAKCHAEFEDEQLTC